MTEVTEKSVLFWASPALSSPFHLPKEAFGAHPISKDSVVLLYSSIAYWGNSSFGIWYQLSDIIDYIPMSICHSLPTSIQGMSVWWVFHGFPFFIQECGVASQVIRKWPQGLPWDCLNKGPDGPRVPFFPGGGKGDGQFAKGWHLNPDCLRQTSGFVPHWQSCHHTCSMQRNPPCKSVAQTNFLTGQWDWLSRILHWETYRSNQGSIEKKYPESTKSNFWK